MLIAIFAFYSIYFANITDYQFKDDVIMTCAIYTIWMTYNLLLAIPLMYYSNRVEKEVIHDHTYSFFRIK